MTDALAIPNGWFQIAYSDELRPGDVQPLSYFDQALVLFRTEDGAHHLADAFCPHLGAHLGHGGVVEGDSIRCPFHGWEFNGEGRCTKVPYAKRIPAKARLKLWTSIERNDMIWAWHHADGAEPQWDVPEVAEAGDDAWREVGRRQWHIATHPQEIGENGVDRAHFRYVHGTKTVPEAEARFEGAIRRATQYVKMPTPRGVVDGRIEVEAHGMGCTITRFTGICETVLILSHTPITAREVHTRFSFLQKRDDADAGAGVAQAVVQEVIRQMEQDIPIWEHKRYHAQPLLCDGDGPIGPYRRWAAQFY